MSQEKAPKPRLLRRRKELNEIEQIQERIVQQAPPPGSNPLAFDKSDATVETAGYAAARLFAELPLSFKTQTALKKANFVTMTDVQRATIPHALAGRDVMGSAKTGSGKTLAFLIPMLESLYRSRWSSVDGLGGLVISPTRELSLQIFDVLRQVGSLHSFSAGLVIGGKDVDEEKTRICGMNILICTPGRLLQHLDETVGFDASTLQVLVLDEADRILDMGFDRELRSIVQSLPDTRQTLLFSATLTKSVRALAQLSLKSPEYCGVHDAAAASTPSRLSQHYMIVDLPKKLDVLWSFIKSHLKSKCVVFLSSCKQVKFVFEAFSRMRPGVVLMALHGKVKQMKRIQLFYDFCKRDAAVLFATDVAARGLDFPSVDWVVQFDCPDSPATYIHRAGRTARNHEKGAALLMLTPSEQAFAQRLAEVKVPCKQVAPNPKKHVNISARLQSMCSEDAEFKYLAQKCFVSYFKSVWLQSDKTVFDTSKLPAEEYAHSLGLAGAPKMKLGEGKKKNVSYAMQALLDSGLKKKAKSGDESSDDADAAPAAPAAKKSKMDKLFSRQNQDVLSKHHSAMRTGRTLLDGDDDADADADADANGDDLFTVKSIEYPSAVLDKASEADLNAPSKRSLRKIKADRKAKSHAIFDEEGNLVKPFERVAIPDSKADPSTKEDMMAHALGIRERMKDRDKEDRLAAKARLKEAKLKKKMQAKLAAAGGDRPPPTLGRDSESQDEEEDEEENESEDDGARRGKRRHQNHGDADGHDDSDAGEGDDAQWAAVDAFALRKSQAAANSGGGGRFSKIEEEEEVALRLLKRKRKQ